MTLQLISLIFTCPQREVKDHSASLDMTCSQHLESLPVACFIDQDYSYKTVATNIPQDAGLL